MWEVSVKGSTDTVYQKLADAFQEEVITEKLQEGVRKMRNGEKRSGGMIATTPEGVSEQFRVLQKSLQSCVKTMNGNIKVTVGGDGKKNLYMKVEAA